MNEKIIKTKEAYVKKTSLKQVLITYIETYKCNECDYEFKEIRKLKNHKWRNHVCKGFLQIPKFILLIKMYGMWRRIKLQNKFKETSIKNPCLVICLWWQSARNPHWNWENRIFSLWFGSSLVIVASVNTNPKSTKF